MPLYFTCAKLLGNDEISNKHLNFCFYNVGPFGFEKTFLNCRSVLMLNGEDHRYPAVEEFIKIDLKGIRLLASSSYIEVTLVPR
jgi:hypothetical protein